MATGEVGATEAGTSKGPAETGLPEKEEGSAQKAKAGSAAPFMLSDCLPPVLAKLVAKILKGEYVEMAELLRDNIEAVGQCAADHASTSSSPNHPHWQEVPDFLSWLQCFGGYACIIATHKPEKIRQLMAYQTIMIREAHSSGGGGQ